MVCDWVVVWKNKKGSMFFRKFRTLSGAIKFQDDFVNPKPDIYHLFKISVGNHGSIDWWK